MTCRASTRCYASIVRQRQRAVGRAEALVGDTVIVRRLGPGDEDVLALLNEQDAAFDLAGRGGPARPLASRDAAEYLTDPTVLHWVAEEQGGAVVGHLLCYVQRRRRGDPRQAMVYEVGVRGDRRRRGVGRSLLDALEAWMRDAGVRGAWVLADNPGAEAFYRACGFAADDDQPVQMSRRVR